MISTGKTGQAHCKVEDIVLQAFIKAFLVHQPLSLGHALVNAPLSGKSLKRGRNLLSFAAFNGFRRLALWGKFSGSNINQGDADMMTLLGTAIADKEPYMADFAIFSLAADPNLIYGKPDKQVTALRDAVNRGWSVKALEGFIRAGAIARDQTEFKFIQQYFVLAARENPRKQFRTVEFMDALYHAGSLINPNKVQRIPTIYTNTLKDIDRYILDAIKRNQLTQEDIDSFQVHGRNFYHFLAFNGFSRTIKYLLRYGLAPEYAEAEIGKRDSFGFDMLLAAIHGNDSAAVIEVLNISKVPVNLKVPSFTGYKNQGKKPLDLAYEWQASPEVISALIRHGATRRVR